MANHQKSKGYVVPKRDRSALKGISIDDVDTPDAIQTLSQFVEFQMGKYEVLCHKKDALFRYAGQANGGRRREAWIKLQEEATQCLRNVRSAINGQA